MKLWRSTSPTILLWIWRIRKSGGIIPSEADDTRTKNTNVWGPERIAIPGHVKREQMCPSCLFVLFSPWTDWWMPTHIGEGECLYSSILNQVLMSSKNTLQSNPDMMFYQLCGHPWGQLSWHLKSTITLTALCSWEIYLLFGCKGKFYCYGLNEKLVRSLNYIKLLQN